MNKGVSIIVFYDEQVRATHGCTKADHRRLIERAERLPFAELFSEYPDPPIPCEHCRGIDAHYADCSRATGN